MNEFDENERLSRNTGSEGAASNRPDEDVQENTTYHYSYKSGNTFGQEGAYYNGDNRFDQQNTNRYYTPPFNSASSVKSVYYESENAPAKKKNKTVLTIILVIAICAVLAVIGIAAASGLGKSTGSSEQGTKPSEPTAQVQTQQQGDVATKDNTGNYTVAGIAENCIDSCVGITVYAKTNAYNNFYSYGYGSESQSDGKKTLSGEGSGILMLEDKGKTYILTCAHVIADGSSFTITANDGQEYEAVMVGYDSQTDIGVLSINATGLKIAEFADSSSTVLGEQVVAIGCPGGLEFINSVTSGYVSALARPISSTIGYDTDCIQIDAPINPGNSGGALFNMQGQVIGVNSSKIAATEYEGIGFAVPSNTAVDTANSLIKVGYVEGRAKIGITYTNLMNYNNASSIVKALENLGFKNAQGTMVINEISSESDLSSKGIRQYDMIVAVNGETLTDTDIITSVLADSKPGDSITLTFARIEHNEIDTFEVECTLIESKGNN